MHFETGRQTKADSDRQKYKQTHTCRHREREIKISFCKKYCYKGFENKNNKRKFNFHSIYRVIEGYGRACR